MNLIGNVAILGTGLLGASFARAVKERGVASKVFAWSRSDSTRVKCAKLESVFDAVFDSPAAAVADADFVVLCTPTENIAPLAKEIFPHLKKNALVTDVGSVKQKICSQCSEIFSNSSAIFIGSHPMAGSEKIGVDFSDAKLFQNRSCFITPIGDFQSPAAQKLKNIWEAVGMRVNFCRPKLHDAIVARISHLPHLLAGLLCVNASNFKDADLTLHAGPGFRDTTRVASGSPDIWDSIIADNKDEILSALKGYSADLQNFISALEKSDGDYIAKTLRDAKHFRDNKNFL